MPVFHSRFSVRAPIEAVYQFHRDARNLPQVQPPYPKVLSLRCPDLLNAGDVVELELGPFPRQTWKALVEELHPPHGNPPRALMIDSAIEGPFPYFRHRHVYIAEGGSTRIEDTIDFDPPFGKAGWLLLPGIHLVLEAMFLYRRIQTRRLLESLNPKPKTQNV